MKVLRYDHLRSAPVVVDVGYARSENRLHSLQPCRSPRPLAGRLLDGIFPLQRLTGHDKSRRSRDMQECADASAKPGEHRVVATFPAVPERSRSLRQVAGSFAIRWFTCCPLEKNPAVGLYTSLRYLVSLGDWRVQAYTRVRPTVFWEKQKLQECIVSLLSKLVSYFLVFQSWLSPKSGSRVIPCETPTNGIALWRCSLSTLFPGFSSFLRP